MGLVSVCLPPQVAVEIPNVKRVKMRRDSQYPTKRDHMICKCLTLSITYAATIGGLITITGTSTNLIFAEQFNTYVNVHVGRSRVSVGRAGSGQCQPVNSLTGQTGSPLTRSARSEITIISLGTTREPISSSRHAKLSRMAPFMWQHAGQRSGLDPGPCLAPLTNVTCIC